MPLADKLMPSQSDMLKAESTFLSALVEAGTDKLEMLLADDFLLADLSGGIMSKAVLIQVVGKVRRNGEFNLTSHRAVARV